MSRFGFALVGRGIIAKKHAHAVHEYLEDADIAAFVETDIARVFGQYGAPAFSSPDEMMRAVATRSRSRTRWTRPSPRCSRTHPAVRSGAPKPNCESGSLRTILSVGQNPSTPTG
jgi:hypothetical protein